MKNTQNKQIHIGFWALLLVITVAACKKETKYDITGDKVNRVYISGSNTTVNGYNSFKFSIVNTVIGAFGTVNVALPVRATMPVAGALKVSFAVDNSMVDTYNAANNTAYKALPDGILNLSAASANIPQGQQISSDSLKIAIPTDKLSQLTENTYLLPVKIAAIAGGAGTQISTNQSVVYLIVSVRVSTSQLFESPGESDMTGSIIANRAKWTGTIDQPLLLGSPADLFDGDEGTFFYYSSANSNLTVDLGETVSGISGIRIKNYFGVYGLTTAKVLSSTDGITYTDYGTANIAGGGSQYIKPYKPFNARYIQLQITGWQNNLIALTEFDLYK
ncbi:BT_3987 domain-containing protein [Mucilaginibacter phyllosphaerae]|nr:DUF1735 domain-containing protein [Mucilaginibacter phyllosphaerae]MBB3969212.1 hypothetical protein [Mucilaginibacter phyllosphaerae]GGH07015.1 hypothetical protein GCM10007352_11530 [Mucilaginibacter phyllosphaerae]